MFNIKTNIFGSKARKRNGFSLLESILSVFLVSMGLVVSIKLLTLGVSQSMKNRDQFAASLLAQEGVELVRNIRDNNWADNDPTTDSFNKITTGTSCRIDYTHISADLVDCSLVSSKQLYLNAGFYNHTANGSATKYYREIIIQDNTTSKTVTSAVRWGSVAFPSIANMSSQCNTANSCAYTQITLNKWGE